MDRQDKKQNSDFYTDLGRDILKATLITVVTVLVRSLSEILTSPQHDREHNDHY